MKKERLKEVTREEFMKALAAGETCYTKKPRSWKKNHYKWENKKEKWFMLLSEDSRQNKQVVTERIGMMIATQLDSHFNRCQREGESFFVSVND